MKNLFFAILVFLLGMTAAAQNVPRAGQILNITPYLNSPGYVIPRADNINDIINFDSLNVSFRGNFPFADSYALAMYDTLVFLGSGGGIYITGVSDPSHPNILSEVRARALIDRCTYDPVKKRLYVCAYFSGIEIWDLSDILNPVRISRIPTNPYPRSGVSFLEDYLIFATNSTVLSYDITDPYNPAFADSLPINTVLVMDSELKDTLFYLNGSSNGIKIINVSDPFDLRLALNTAYASGTQFDISENYLYAVKDGSMMIMDITDPLSITFTGSVAITDFPEDIKVVGTKAYIAKMGTGGGVQIVDVANPSSPAIISLYPGNFRFIEGAGNSVYVTGGTDFKSLNVTDPLNVTELSALQTPAFTEDAAVIGNYLYTGSNGFRVLDLSDTARPVQAGYSPINGGIVEAADNSLVLYCPHSMGTGNKVYVMDVSNPTAPVAADSIAVPVMTQDLAVQDTLVYLAAWWDGVRVFNFKDPQNLSYVSHVMGWTQGGTPGVDWCYAQAVAVEGSYLYIVDYHPFPDEDTYGLYIIDVSDPSAPFLANRFVNMSSYPQDITVANGIAYIADGYGGVEIVNVTDPLNPAVISYVSLPDGATGIDVNGEYAYVSNYILGGVEVIDISTPATPVLTGYYKPSGCFALGVTADNGCIYVADGLAGIQVYRNLLEPVTAAEDPVNTVNSFEVSAYPNPFNPAATIRLNIPEAGLYKIKVYNSIGEEVALLLNDYLSTGIHKVQFNAAGLPSGVYFYRVDSQKRSFTGKLVLLK